MIFVYTDDILVVSHKPRESLTMLDHHYLLKPNSIGIPKTYLGSQVATFDINNDSSQRCWSLGLAKYVKSAINNVKQWLEAKGRMLKTKAAEYPHIVMIQLLPTTNWSPPLDCQIGAH